MELKAKCNTCIHGDMCARRMIFEALFEDEEVMAPIKNVNEIVEWIEIDIRCRDYGFDPNKQETMSEPEKRKLFGFNRGLM